MAQKAEEYGSHDKTFEIEAAGSVRVVDSSGDTLLEHDVEPGDIWRGCQTKDAAVADWVRLAVERARETGAPAVFWLDESRAHDAEILKKVERRTRRRGHRRPADRDPARRRGGPLHARTGQGRRGHDLGDRQRAARLPHRPLPDPRAGHEREDALDRPAHRRRRAVRDGRRRSHEKHVQQFTKENHLRWDSLGEFLALAAALEFLAGKAEDPLAVLGKALDRATGKLLENGKAPSRKVGELDNRGSHSYLTLYWAQALAEQTEDEKVQQVFAPLAERLADDEETIVSELNDVQGEPVELGGYYWVDRDKATAAMRPSATFNAARSSRSSRGDGVAQHRGVRVDAAAGELALPELVDPHVVHVQRPAVLRRAPGRGPGRRSGRRRR